MVLKADRGRAPGGHRAAHQRPDLEITCNRLGRYRSSRGLYGG